MSDLKSEKSGGLKLDLPERQEWGLQNRGNPSSMGFWILGILLVAVIVIQLLSFSQSKDSGKNTEATNTGSNGIITNLPLRDLSARLQRNNLHSAAAEVLEQHLKSLPVKNKEEGRKTLVSIGTQLIKAKRYEEAIVRLYQAELLQPDSDSQKFIGLKVKECLEKLGKHDELAHELADRSAPGWKPGQGTGPGTEAAGKEVARIGLEVITAGDLDAMISEDVDRQLKSIPGLAGEERDTYRTQILNQLQAPQKRLQKLQELVVKKVLYREGMERELDKNPSVKEELELVQEGLIANQVIFDAMDSRIRVSENDMKLFFQAEQGRYIQKESAKILIMILPDEKSAADSAASIKTEEEFSTLAQEKSLETSTRDQGGLVNAPVVAGEPFPLLGSVPELTAAVLATDAGKVTTPVKTSKGFALAFVTEKTPQRTPSFNEIRAKVAKDYTQLKEMEVQQQLIKELFEKHAVSIRAEAFIKLPETEKDDQK